MALALASYQAGRSDLGAVLTARREALDTRLRLIDLDETQRAPCACVSPPWLRAVIAMNKTLTASRSLSLLLAAGVAVGWGLASWREAVPSRPATRDSAQ